MTLFGRSDIESQKCIGDESKTHVKKKGQEHIELDCPACEGVFGGDPRFDDTWSRTLEDVPLTPDEQKRADRELEEGTSIQNAVAREIGRAHVEAIRQAGAPAPTRGRGRARTAA